MLIGEGEACVEGARAAGAAGLARGRHRAAELGAKEGLALLNGTQVSTALALAALFAAERPASRAALVAGAMTVDAARGSDTPFDPRIHALRGQPGQIRVAAALPRAARRQRHPRLAPRRRHACRTPIRCAASRR